MRMATAICLAMVLTLGYGASSAHSRSEAGTSIIVTEQTVKPVTARVGQAVQIRLRSQPGTGFSWVPKNYAASLTALSPIQGQAIPGGWQTQRFRFVAKRPGTYRLNFSYDRSWNGGTKGARTRGFTIKVR
jgi:predicted secreted protein